MKRKDLRREEKRERERERERERIGEGQSKESNQKAYKNVKSVSRPNSEGIDPSRLFSSKFLKNKK